jgi:peptidoglycan/xylan/chitin deacetylase (PgdA/CDA1 family)
MRLLINRLLEWIADRIPPALLHALVRRESVDIFYHAVSDDYLPHVRHLYPVVPVKAFEEALVLLNEQFTFISYPQLHAHRFSAAILPPRSIHLSFDDGYAQCYSVVRPLLLELGIPCTFFLTTELIDNPSLFYRNKVSLCIQKLDQLTENEAKDIYQGLNQTFGLDLQCRADFVYWIKELRLPDETVIDQVCQNLGVDWRALLHAESPYLTTPQIQEMRAEGFTIGAHTHSHRKLAALSAGEIEEEIAGSCRTIQGITGDPVVPFSFPHSATGIDRNLLSAILDRHPFIGLMFDTKGLRLDEKYIVNRVWAERPIPPQKELQPITAVLNAAYRETWVEETLAAGRKMRPKNK